MERLLDGSNVIVTDLLPLLTHKVLQYPEVKRTQTLILEWHIVVLRV